jgi:hypothetical protein
MNLLHRILNISDPNASPEKPARHDQPTQPATSLRTAPPPEPSPVEFGPELPAESGPEFGPGLPEEVRSAAKEGIPAFPVEVGSLLAPAATRLLKLATTDIPALEELVEIYPQCRRGLAMGGKVFAVRMDGECGVARLNNLAREEALATDDDGEWGTRLLAGGTTTWALFLCPELEMRLNGRSREDLAIAGTGDWIPAPGSEFAGVTYSYLDPEARIEPAPNCIAGWAFNIPEAA